MIREKRNQEWAGDLQKELKEIESMEVEAETEGIGAYVTFSVGCANFFTVACC